MGLAKTYPIKENIEEIKKAMKKAPSFLLPRLQLLLLEKQNEDKRLSKAKLSNLLGVCKSSIQNWRNLYQKEGLLGLLSHNRGKSHVSSLASEHDLISKKINDSENGLSGYKELHEWLEKESHKSFKYRNVYNYCVQHFKSKIKVARKSHIKKDESKVEAFKKTSVPYVN